MEDESWQSGSPRRESNKNMAEYDRVLRKVWAAPPSYGIRLRVVLGFFKRCALLRVVLGFLCTRRALLRVVLGFLFTCRARRASLTKGGVRILLQTTHAAKGGVRILLL